MITTSLQSSCASTDLIELITWYEHITFIYMPFLNIELKLNLKKF